MIFDRWLHFVFQNWANAEKKRLEISNQQQIVGSMGM